MNCQGEGKKTSIKESEQYTVLSPFMSVGTWFPGFETETEDIKEIVILVKVVDYNLCNILNWNGFWSTTNPLE